MKTTLKYINQISHFALDIETAPIMPLSEYDSSTQHYINAKIARLKVTDPTMTYEKFASLNANFGRIICLSVGYVAETADGEPAMLVRSSTGSEEDILQEFNRRFAGYQHTFVSFNGRSFDVPFMLTRMSLLRIPCLNSGFANVESRQGHPHFDLLQAHSYGDPAKRVPLQVLATLAGLPSPKMDLDGSKIWQAFQDGEIRRIARYCESDVATTLNLVRMLVGGYDPIPSERLYTVECDGELCHLAGVRPDGSCPSIWDAPRPQFASMQSIPALKAG